MKQIQVSGCHEISKVSLVILIDCYWSATIYCKSLMVILIYGSWSATTYCKSLMTDASLKEGSICDLMMIKIMFSYGLTTRCYDISWYSDTLQWRHNELDSVSNHQTHDCLLNRLFRTRSKKTSKLRVTGLCVGNSPGTGEFPTQIASNTENVSIWWRHHDTNASPAHTHRPSLLMTYFVSFGLLSIYCLRSDPPPPF